MVNLVTVAARRSTYLLTCLRLALTTFDSRPTVVLPSVAGVAGCTPVTAVVVAEPGWTGAVADITAAELLVDATAGTTAVAAEPVAVEPPAFEAVTMTTSVLPTSASVTTYD